jgi:hypothetical protein
MGQVSSHKAVGFQLNHSMMTGRATLLQSSCAVGLLISTLSCMAEPTKQTLSARTAHSLSSWIFATPEGSPYPAELVRGRTTIVLFLTTYDTASQIAATRLNSEIHRFSRKANAIGVALEPPNHSVLVGVFHDSLHLTYPLLMPDPATLSGDGPFGRIDVVPTWVILDELGRETLRRTGVRAIPELQTIFRRLGAGAE